MGEYEPPRERPEDGGLYPLNAEGTYGRVPKNRNPGRWQELPKYQKREKKPKLYASYAISDKCELHSLVLDKYMRPPKCSVHSSSGSGRSSRATSAPPQNLTVTEVKEKSVEKSSRQASLPPVEVGSTMMLKVQTISFVIIVTISTFVSRAVLCIISIIGCFKSAAGGRPGHACPPQVGSREGGGLHGVTC